MCSHFHWPAHKESSDKSACMAYTGTTVLGYHKIPHFCLAVLRAELFIGVLVDSKT